VSKRVGLPDSHESKYGPHFVEEISSRTRTSIIRNIPLGKIIPNVLQPRKDFGNLEELAKSIKEKGIIEPILVRPREGQFEIIAGERRYKAAEIAGLKEVPCIQYEVADNEALELSIIENIQRKDLDIYEYAFSLKSLAEIYGYTHEDISQKIGKSRVTVTELLRITDLPPEVVTRCTELNISSKTFLLELVKLEDQVKMFEVLENYSEKPFSREKIKEQRKEEKESESGPKNKAFKFNFVSDDKRVKINFNIKTETFEKDSIIQLLEKLIQDIREDKINELSLK